MAAAGDSSRCSRRSTEEGSSSEARLPATRSATAAIGLGKGRGRGHGDSRFGQGPRAGGACAVGGDEGGCSFGRGRGNRRGRGSCRGNEAGTGGGGAGRGSEMGAVGSGRDMPPDDVLREIFLRLPPEPECLIRISLVCKLWHCLVRDPVFLRRFRAFHRTLALLGFFHNSVTDSFASFVHTADGVASLSPPSEGEVADSRHGLVLLDCGSELVVWDPMTGDSRYVGFSPTADYYTCTHSLVCMADHDHGDCHSCPFCIVSVFSVDMAGYDIVAHVYSSQTGMWDEVAAITIPMVLADCGPSALVGNSLYWLLCGRRHVLRFKVIE